MSDQGWNSPSPPGGQEGGQPPQEWGQQPPPPQGQPPQNWGQQPPPPQGQPPQNWGQQPGQPGQPSGGSALEPPVAGVLAYVPFAWLGGLVIYLINKDPLSRFQGAQSILLSIVAFAVWIVTFVAQIVAALALPRGFAGIIGLLWWIVWFAWFGLSVYLAVQAYNLKKVTLPVIGPMAEKWAAK